MPKLKNESAIKSVSVLIRMTPKEAERLDNLCIKHNIGSRSELIRKLIKGDK